MDTQAPKLTSISRASPTSQLTNASEVAWRFNFDEPIQINGSLVYTISGATVTPTAVTYTTNSIRVTFSTVGLADGTLTPSISNPSAISDAGGNVLASATPTGAVGTYILDRARPTVTLPSTLPGSINSSLVSMSAIFSESVIGFGSGDVSVTNGSVFMVSHSGGGSYTILITPYADGPVTVTIGENVATDAAGNGNTASNTISFTVDRVEPGVTLLSTVDPVSNATPVPVTVAFTESVTGFDASDLVLVNATATNFLGSDRIYSFELVPSGDGPVSVSIAADAATDAGGNGNMASNAIAFTHDATAPGVTLSGTVDPVSNAASVPVTVSFTESVTGFDASDLVLVNATATNFAGSGNSYSFDLVPSGDGPVSVSIAAGAATDAGGNGNTAATAFAFTHDATAPGVTLSGTVDPVSNATLVPVTVSFTESVTGFDASDLVLVNATATNFAGSGNSYSFDLVPSGDGPVSVSIAADAATDAGGNGNTAATAFGFTHDATAPGVTLATTAPALTNQRPVPVTVTFTKPVTGFDLADLVIVNGVAGNLTGSGASYAFDLTPTSDGAVTVDLAAGAATDVGGNGNTAAGQLALTFDGTAPTATLSGTAGPAGAPYPLTIRFSKPVTGLDLGDFDVSQASLSALTGSGDSYQVMVTAAAGHTVQLRAGAVTDAAGNGNTVSNLFQVQGPGTVPVLTMSGLPAVIVPGEAFTITFSFSQPVTGFGPQSVTVLHGALSGFAGGPERYTALVAADGGGDLMISVADGAAFSLDGIAAEGGAISARLHDPSEANAAIAEFLQLRARALVQAQPRLMGFVNGKGEGVFSVSSKGGALSYDLHTGFKAPIWLSLTGSATDGEGAQDLSYGLATIGSHMTLANGMILGAMVQLDRAELTTRASASVEGTGWLVGPYVAGQIQDQPLYFEGRLLYGQTSNTLHLPGVAADEFEGSRWLAMFALQGEFATEYATYMPVFTLTHAVDMQDAYTDSFNTLVPEQRVSLTEVSLGTNVEIPLAVSEGTLVLTGGGQLILSDYRGNNTASAYITETDDLRGRVDLGFRYNNGRGLVASASGFLDGIGANITTTGLNAQFELSY